MTSVVFGLRDRKRPEVSPMSDPLSWSPISLGRWFGTSVRIHVTLIIFLVIRLASSAMSIVGKGDSSQLLQTACWLGLLLLSLVLHELGHAAVAAWLDCEQGEVNIWPLGSLVGPSFAPVRAKDFWWQWPGWSPAARLSWRSPSG